MQLTRVAMGEWCRIKPVGHCDKFNDEVICPKPRRPSAIGPQDLLRLPCRTRSHINERDVGFEILDMILRKSGYGDTSGFSCSPPYFCGSPPSRTGNPLIHDVQFIHQRHQNVPLRFSPPSSHTDSSRALKPHVRVEGFVPSGPDSRCSVLALA